MRRVLGLIAYSAAWLCGASALAQISLEEFSTSRFVPAPGRGNFLSVDGANVRGHMVSSVGLTLDYAHKPFVLFSADCVGGNLNNCSVIETKANLVETQAVAYLTGALAIAERFQLGLVVPVGYYSGERFSSTTADGFVFIRGGDHWGPGDARVTGKVQIVRPPARGGLGVAAAAFVTAPLSRTATKSGSCQDRVCPHLGDQLPTGGAYAIVAYDRPRLRLAGNVGALLRVPRTLLRTTAGPAATYSFAAAMDLTSLLRVLVELSGSTSLKRELDENPMELRLAGQLRQSDFLFTLGAGAGLIAGVGVPVVRGLAGAAWRPLAEDADGDGVRDLSDTCPNEKEDLDGYLDDDGCPDLDNDGDGLNDPRDRCPDEPEDADGHEDEDGCPDDDNDGDGVEDGYDACPNEPEDMDKDRDGDGCPDHDADRDGVPDDQDKCPDQPEDTDGYGDEDGCPEEDFDGDHIPDDKDYCPDQAEDWDVFEDDDGCPEMGGDPIVATQPSTSVPSPAGPSPEQTTSAPGKATPAQPSSTPTPRPAPAPPTGPKP